MTNSQTSFSVIKKESIKEFIKNLSTNFDNSKKNLSKNLSRGVYKTPLIDRFFYLSVLNIKGDSFD